MLQPPGSSSGRRAAAPSRKKQQESPDDVIRQLQRLAPNKRCADCNSKLPSCVNLTIGSFVCITCAGIHRELSARVKGVGHSSFTAEEAEQMKQTDNEKVNVIYLARYNPSVERMRAPQDNSDQQHLRRWIHLKYKDRAWYGGGGVSNAHAPQPPSQRQGAQSFQPTVAQIPPKQPDVDLFGGFGSPAPAPAAPSARNSNHGGWDAFGGGSQTQTQQQNTISQQQAHDFPADFGSSQSKQQFQQPSQPTQQMQPGFQANFADFSAPAGGAPAQQQPQPPPQQQQHQQQQPLAFQANFGNFGQQPPQQPVQQQQPPTAFQPNFHQQQPQQQASQQQQQPFKANFGAPQIVEPQQQQSFEPQQQQSFQTNFSAPQNTQASVQQQPAQQPQGGFANFDSAQQPSQLNMPGHQQPLAGFMNMGSTQQPPQVSPQAQQQAPAGGFANFNSSQMPVQDIQKPVPQQEQQQQQQQQQQQGGFPNLGNTLVRQPPPQEQQQQIQQTASPNFNAASPQKTEEPHGFAAFDAIGQKPPKQSQGSFGTLQQPQQQQSYQNQQQQVVPETQPSATPATTQAQASPSLGLENLNIKETTDEQNKGTSKYKAGQKVYYKSSSYVGEARVEKVHFDDALVPFYTISVNGKEKQTDDHHLADKSPLREEIDKILDELPGEKLKQVVAFLKSQVQSNPTNPTSSIQSPSRTSTPPVSQPSPVPVQPQQTQPPQQQNATPSQDWGAGIPSLGDSVPSGQTPPLVTHQTPVNVGVQTSQTPHQQQPAGQPAPQNMQQNSGILPSQGSVPQNMQQNPGMVAPQGQMQHFNQGQAGMMGGGQMPQNPGMSMMMQQPQGQVAQAGLPNSNENPGFSGIPSPSGGPSQTIGTSVPGNGLPSAPPLSNLPYQQQPVQQQMPQSMPVNVQQPNANMTANNQEALSPKGNPFDFY